MDSILRGSNQYFHTKIFRLIGTLFITCIVNTSPGSCDTRVTCEDPKKLKYVWGDALTDPSNCLGPEGAPYPSSTITKIFRRTSGWGTSRKGRSYGTIDPLVTQRTLLKNYQSTNDMDDRSFLSRTRRDYGSQETCMGTPSRLCKTRYNTTAPMYGVSLTSGQPVTIVQKFPDLLQQVVYEVCESSECDVVRGECTQTYVPYLFLVIPLGPVTLTGQDYVLVESGCVCKPKYASHTISEPNSMSAIPNL